MSDVGKAERVTQNRIVALFKNELGYHYCQWRRQNVPGGGVKVYQSG